MKKIIALLLLAVMCFTMVACNNGTTPGGDQGGSGNGGGGGDKAPEKVTYAIPEGGYDGSEVTITFSHTMNAGYQAVLDQYIAKFNEIYPNITVEHSQIGGYDEVRDQIKTELTAGNQPNIAYCYPDHVALYNVTKKVVPLDSFIESQIPDTLGGGILGLTEEQIADFVPGYYAEGAVFDEAGTMYTLPMSKSTEVLYYNKTFFDKYDLKVPTTWDEMEETCAAIHAIINDPTSEDYNPDAIPLGYDSEANWFITLCEQYNSPYTSSDKTDHYVFNNKTNREFMKEIREWYDKGYLTTQELYGSYTSGLFTEQNLFMCIGSSGGSSYQRPEATDDGYLFDVDIAPIPQKDLNDPAAISQGPSLCIFDQTNKQEVVASWLFVKYLATTPEFQAAFSKVSGYMPVIRSANEIESYKKWLEKADGGDNIQALAIKVGLSQENAYFVSPAFNGSSEARDQVGKLLQFCLVTDPATYGGMDEMILEGFKAAVATCIAKS